MIEKSLSSQYTILFKMLPYLFFIICLFGGLIILINDFELKSLILISTVLGILLALIKILQNLKEIAFTDNQIIIKDLKSKKGISLNNVTKIYAINIGAFYRMEYSENGHFKYVDIWPSTNFFKMLNGELPKNFEEFLNKLK